MDRVALISKLRGLAKGVAYLFGGIGAIGLVWFVANTAPIKKLRSGDHNRQLASAVSHSSHHEESHAKEEGHTKPGELKSGWAVMRAIKSVQEKMEELERTDDQNKVLKLENANLRLQVEDLKFSCSAKQAQAHAANAGPGIHASTGSLLGRTLDTIQYKPPTHLMPDQLYTLGVSYFKAREDEKAAVILTFLTGFEDNTVFKSAKNFLMTGVAWYRLDNYKVADEFFEKAMRAPDAQEQLQYQAQARLWKALASDKLGNKRRSQEWLRDLLDHHPHSIEASWVNEGASLQRGIAGSGANEHH